MRKPLLKLLLALIAVAASGAALMAASGRDPLPSWNDGKSKAAILAFVARVTDEKSPDFVPAAERIATFDNDGTLWSEQPLYFQALFALDRVRAAAVDHPEWKTTEPYRSAIAGDMAGLMAAGMEGIEKVLLVAHANMTAEEFAASVGDWMATAKHPKTGRKYTDMVYQPMLELLDYLRANGFRTFIVSGGGIDFMRVFAEEVYGIPPEQVVGSELDAQFEMRDGRPTIVKTPKLLFVDDKAGKPVGIYRHIGRRPIFAAGNSDGDLQMLQYATITGNGEGIAPGFGLIVHHTDAEREWAYDRDSHIGKLDKALDEATARGWTVVDMKSEWKTIYPVE
ncbi:MAG TPA: HAD family hydrolase [Woeseiaceae bacterium]|nr:HAD family hydrolase [Woeseiaceae bacterium]